ncbi:uncharacterized protein LOC118750446 [Rhagoletis pomonella]|uniref:uncharacterized protein LOC118750446 n=1 Tax=Rhagoletis pomonella TaxID=28610 RepID=UPI001780917D|nr:uncharacterized protein LOC118750446 [Rhagoletis pomonella]
MGEVSATRYANRGTPQGGVLSPLLWNLTVNTLLSQLQSTGCQVVAYADDLALTAVGKHPQILCDLVQGALGVVETWSKKSGLSVNPGKTVMVLFTKKIKTVQVQLPFLNGVTLALSEEVRYLGVVLDRKLTWRRNVEERGKKALTALYACKSAIRKKWGLKPHIVSWMYTAVVPPILFYGITVWWPSVDKLTIKSRLTKVQRVACMMITGALPSTPTKALETLLHFLPVDLYGKLQASCNAVRLNPLIKWSDTRFGYSRILENLPGNFRRLDYTVPPTGLKNHFQTRIPSRGELEEDSILISYSDSAAIYTDGSKLDLKVGSGIYSQELSLSLSFRLPDYCSVFQAEVTAIYEAARWLIDSPTNLHAVTIFSDSQAAIQALNCDKSSSKIVMECRRTLNELARSHFTRVVWVPGHREIPGNCVADELARKGTLLPAISTARNASIPPSFTVKSQIGVGFSLRPLNLHEDSIMLISYPGELFMRVLKLMILPLIISSLIAGSASLNARMNGKIALRTLVYFVTTSFLNALLGIALVLLIHPGDPNLHNTVDRSTDKRAVNLLDSLLDLGSTSYQAIG